jgi:hypothetical protein
MKLATIEDLERAIPLACEWYSKCGFKNAFNPEKFLRFWKFALDSGFGTVFYRESNGKVIEAIGVIQCEDFMDGLDKATIQFWMVDESNGLCRGMLLLRMLKILDDRGVSVVRAQSNLRYRYKDVFGFLKKIGFEPKEVGMEKVLTE